MRAYTLFKRSYMGHNETAWLKIHDVSSLADFSKAFHLHTGYASTGAAADAFWFQFMEIRCSKHPKFQQNRDELREIIRIFKLNAPGNTPG